MRMHFDIIIKFVYHSFLIYIQLGLCNLQTNIRLFVQLFNANANKILIALFHKYVN